MKRTLMTISQFLACAGAVLYSYDLWVTSFPSNEIKSFNKTPVIYILIVVPFIALQYLPMWIFRKYIIVTLIYLVIWAFFASEFYHFPPPAQGDMRPLFGAAMVINAAIICIAGLLFLIAKKFGRAAFKNGDK